MILRELMQHDTPCDAGIEFIEREGLADKSLAESWDIIKEKTPLFLGWAVKHAPKSEEKLRALRLVKASGADKNERLNHDPSVAVMCFGWMKNPFRVVV